jgi:predicted small lipoprotein YifL
MTKKILGAAILALLATACGQKGNLYFAGTEAARNRASLGQSLRPSMPASATPAPQAEPLPALDPATPPLPLPGS